ncbi:MAG: hypothetical protein Q8P12_07640, partial [bacterium]|nr:hypothetical protein [bacterium]
MAMEDSRSAFERRSEEALARRKVSTQSDEVINLPDLRPPEEKTAFERRAEEATARRKMPSESNGPIHLPDQSTPVAEATSATIEEPHQSTSEQLPSQNEPSEVREENQQQAQESHEQEFVRASSDDVPAEALGGKRYAFFVVDENADPASSIVEPGSGKRLRLATREEQSARINRQMSGQGGDTRPFLKEAPPSPGQTPPAAPTEAGAVASMAAGVEAQQQAGAAGPAAGPAAQPGAIVPPGAERAPGKDESSRPGLSPEVSAELSNAGLRPEDVQLDLNAIRPAATRVGPRGPESTWEIRGAPGREFTPDQLNLLLRAQRG